MRRAIGLEVDGLNKKVESFFKIWELLFKIVRKCSQNKKVGKHWCKA